MWQTFLTHLRSRVYRHRSLLSGGHLADVGFLSAAFGVIPRAISLASQVSAVFVASAVVGFTVLPVGVGGGRSIRPDVGPFVCLVVEADPNAVY